MGADVRRRMAKMSDAVESDRMKIARKGAKAAKDEHAKRIRRDSGGDMRMSGVGKRGRKVGVRFDEQSNRVLIRATGPLHLLDRPTKAHRIPRRRGGRARKRYVVIPGAGRRGGAGVFESARHPGTRGKGTWTKQRRRAIFQARGEIERAAKSTVSKAFTS